MEKISSPCASGVCPAGYELGNSDLGQEMCISMQSLLVKAGGSSVLEKVVCPYKALTECDPNGLDPIKAEIGKKVGVIAGVGVSNA